ncbi:unnamed protein product [Ectocarpus sp. 6 AP-2014]
MKRRVSSCFQRTKTKTKPCSLTRRCFETTPPPFGHEGANLSGVCCNLCSNLSRVYPAGNGRVEHTLLGYYELWEKTYQGENQPTRTVVYKVTIHCRLINTTPPKVWFARSALST